jgi:hypothetical protein
LKEGRNSPGQNAIPALHGFDAATLEVACGYAREKAGTELRSVPENPARCAAYVRRWTRDLFSSIIAERKRTSAQRAQLDPMLSFLDMAIHHLFLVGATCGGRSRMKQKQPYSLFEIVSLALGNTLVGIRELTLAGLDNQARVLFRYYVELAEMMLAIVGDKAAYKTFIGCGIPASVNTPKYWREHLNPRKVRESLISIEKSAGLTQGYVQLLARDRRKTYQWLSGFSHCNIFTALSGAYRSELGKRWDILRPCVGGRLGRESKRTLYRLADYNASFFYSLNELLLKNHAWKSALESDENMAWAVYHAYVFLFLFVGLGGKMGRPAYARKRKRAKRAEKRPEGSTLDS